MGILGTGTQSCWQSFFHSILLLISDSPDSTYAFTEICSIVETKGPTTVCFEYLPAALGLACAGAVLAEELKGTLADPAFTVEKASSRLTDAMLSFLFLL